MKFIIKQYLKMFMQGIFLPIIYTVCRLQPVNKRLAVFADAHHTSVPFSMRQMHVAVESEGFEIVDCIEDFSTMNIWAKICSMVSFMILYSRAKYVFLCDYYLPVSSCKKRPETIVVQLWHSGGLMKTFGYDASEDIPLYYKLNPFKNYDIVTVSASCCEAVLAKAMRLPKEIVKSTGISRSDCYFDNKFLDTCIAFFYKQYPWATGKKIVLWAPTFRGNAASPVLEGTEDILELQKKLGWEYLVLIKAHPYIDKQRPISNCLIPSEELLPVVDLLITDYSSILFDYIIFEKPFVLFCPDYQEYKQKRGFYIDYESLPGPIVTSGVQVAEAVRYAITNSNRRLLSECRKHHMGKCDGHATQRILDQIIE